MSNALTTRDAVTYLREVTAAFATALDGADETQPVSTCPGWTVRDLAVHLGSVHRWAASIVLSGHMPKLPVPLIDRPLSEWYQGTANAMSAAFGAVSPDEPIPNFTRVNEVASFWPRRQLHETTVHLRDLTLALGEPDVEVDSIVAADGVHEVLTVSFQLLAVRENPPVVLEPIRISATDTGDEWVVSPDAIGQIAPAETPCSASLSGTASDLYFAFWGRVPHSRLTVEGASAAALLEGPTSR